SSPRRSAAASHPCEGREQMPATQSGGARVGHGRRWAAAQLLLRVLRELRRGSLLRHVLLLARHLAGVFVVYLLSVVTVRRGHRPLLASCLLLFLFLLMMRRRRGGRGCARALGVAVLSVSGAPAATADMSTVTPRRVSHLPRLRSMRSRSRPGVP